MGRVGSCFDNAASEAFFSTLEHEVLSRHHFRTRAEARAVVVPWCQDFYNVKRRHSSAALLAPDEYERIAAIQPESNRQYLWIKIFYAASSVAVVSSGRSTSVPFSNFAPARTSATRWGALTARQRDWAASISL